MRSGVATASRAKAPVGTLAPKLVRAALAGNVPTSNGSSSHVDSHDWDHHPDLYTHHGWPNHHDFGHHGFGHHWNDHHFGLYFGWGIPYWPYYSTWYAPTWGSGSTTYIVQTDEVLPTSSSEVPPVYEEEPVPLEVDATVPTPEPNAALQAPVEGIVPIAPLVETREAPESLPEETPPAPAPSRPESP